MSKLNKNGLFLGKLGKIYKIFILLLSRSEFGFLLALKYTKI